MYTVNPDNLGVLDKPLEVRDMYISETIVYITDLFSVTYPEGGFIVPGYMEGQIWGFTIYGRGQYEIIPRNSKGISVENELLKLFQGKTNSILVQLHPSKFQEFRDFVLIEQTFNTQVKEYAEDIFHGSGNNLPGFEVFGTRRVFLPSYGDVLVSLTTEDSHFIKVADNSRSFLEINGIRYPIERENNYVYSPLNNIKRYIFYSLIFILIITLITLLTLDIKKKEKSLVQRIVTSKEVGYLALYLLLLFILDQFTFYSFAIMGLVVISSCVVFKVPLKNIGFTYNNTMPSLVIALVVSFIIIFVSKLKGPGIFISTPQAAILWMIRMFLLYYLPRELFYRGYVQGTIDRLTNRLAAIFIVPLIISIIWILPLALYGSIGNNILIASLLLMPMEFINSYTYYKTRNVMAPALIGLFIAFVNTLFRW
jgi:hypothetical protein